MTHSHHREASSSTAASYSVFISLKEISRLGVNIRMNNFYLLGLNIINVVHTHSISWEIWRGYEPRGLERILEVRSMFLSPYTCDTYMYKVYGVQNI